MSAIVPTPRVPLSIRPATLADVPFMDSLQKLHTRQVGWFPTKQFEGYVGMNAVLVAESGGERVGYCIARDKYGGRDDVGAIYQLNVAPARQRGLIGAALVRATFERAAYGCRLFCCWCAQDIAAGHFWQSVGFVPLAFRTGSRSRGKDRMPRIHVFWQRRVREEDETTPWWYPYQTRNGAIREDRLVFPIPPGTRWQDAVPVVLPESVRPVEEPKPAVLTLPDGRPVRTRPEQAPRPTQAARMAVVRSQSRHLQGLPAGKSAVIVGGRIRYVERGDAQPEPEPVKEKPKREPKPKAKHDEKAVAFTRELRDRYLEKVAREPWLLPASAGRYAVGLAPPPPMDDGSPRLPAPPVRLLPAA